MSLWDRIRGRSPTNEKKTGNQIQMITTSYENYYAFDGNLYKSDIVRACIKPKVKAVGKLLGQHIRETASGLVVNPEPYIKRILSNPNPYMSGQMLLEKLTNQLCLNNNAFAIVVKDANGYAEAIYPIPCTLAEAIYDQSGELFIKFYFRNGRISTFAYSDLIHLRDDFNEHDVFGTSPTKALTQLMDCVGTIDQGIVKAVKNSGIVKWLLKFNSSMRPEDVRRNTKEFVDNYLNYESDAFGAAGVDAKVDAKQIEPKDYVPNSAISEKLFDRIYSFFGVNKNIVQSSWNEDQWNAYYEAQIEPLAIQLSDCWTNALFTNREKGFNNKIVFESTNLACASMQTKLQFRQMVDLGAMSLNEWRRIMNMSPIPDGDVYVRRLDTTVVNMVEKMLDQMTPQNTSVMADLIKSILNFGKGGIEDGKN